jgi:hypothetical protein
MADGTITIAFTPKEILSNQALQRASILISQERTKLSVAKPSPRREPKKTSPRSKKTLHPTNAVTIRK